MSFLAALEYINYLAAFFYIIYLLSFTKVIFHTNSSNSKQNSAFVSVLICAKNEAQQLQHHLPSILNQNYSNFEVVVVNDQSSDETLKVLQDFQEKNKHLKVFTTHGESNKKKALQLAKEKASGSIYVLTDADCKIVSKFWLEKMLENIETDYQVVIGYAPHLRKPGFLSKLQSFETLTTALQYTTAALLNSPYMAVGRNFAYTKHIDEKIKFDKDEAKLLSGDDDLWLQKAKKFTKVQVQLAKNTFAYSQAEPNLKLWWNQKRRHISTANHYQLKDQLILSAIFLTKILYWLSFIVLVSTSPNMFFWLAFLSLLFTFLIIYKLASKKLNEKNIWWISPFLDFSLICFQFCLFIANLVSPIRKWK